MSKYIKTIYTNDWHSPYVDAECFEVLCQVIKDVKPDQIILNGDIHDFYQVSKYSKDPSRLTHLQDDLNRTHELFHSLRTFAPRAEILFKEGNHELRMENYLRSHSEIASLDCLSVPSLLKCDIFNIKYIDTRTDLVNHGFYVTHGTQIMSQSAYSAHAEWRKYGCIGISGHTHRLGIYYHRCYGGQTAWYESGCLCQLNPEYVAHPNWQQGFTLVYHKSTSPRYELHQVPVVGGCATIGGTEYTSIAEEKRRKGIT